MRLARSPFKRSFDKRSDRGAVIVEFAIMLPLLALIILLIVDLGWILREQQILENAAREGARFSAIDLNQVGTVHPSATIAQIKQVVIQYCAQENITVTASDITVNQNYLMPVGAGTVDCSEVIITYSRPFLLPGTGLLPANQMTLVGRAVMRNLY